MIGLRKIMACVAVCAGFAAMPGLAHSAEPQAIMQITMVDTHGKTPEYLVLVRKVIERQHKVAPGIDTHIYQATFAGPQAGTLYLVMKYPNIQFMISAHAKLAQDAEWNELRREAALKTGRTLISDSLFADLTE